MTVDQKKHQAIDSAIIYFGYWPYVLGIIGNKKAC